MEKIDVKEIEARLHRAYPLSGRWHNGFHLEMPFGLINDPNGLCFYQGAYHIFYQWNPLSCQHKNKSWAYVKTKDFVHYTLPTLAMKPTDIHDKDGCYSGCGFVDKGALRVLYTCNAKDEAGHRTPAQRLGTLQADGHIVKDEIVVDKEAQGYTSHYRDPYVFARDGERYFVLGAQNNEKKGRGVIYKELANKWQLLGELKTAYADFGYMWECPNLLQFVEGEALLFCPQGLEPQAYGFQNRYQSGYIAGKLNMADLSLTGGQFQELDRGFDFYAPQVLENNGRHILLGWMGMPEDEADYPSAEDGWLFSLTVPRELRLSNGHIYQQPIEELKALRQPATETIWQADNVDSYQQPLADKSEIEFTVELGKAKAVAFDLIYGEERLSFSYDRVNQVMTIDRNGMKLGGRGQRQFILPAEDKLQIQLLVDKSAVEVFFQQGLETAAMLIFPKEEANPVFAMKSAGKIKSLQGKSWTLDSFTFA